MYQSLKNNYITMYFLTNVIQDFLPELLKIFDWLQVKIIHSNQTVKFLRDLIRHY